MPVCAVGSARSVTYSRSTIRYPSTQCQARSASLTTAADGVSTTQTGPRAAPRTRRGSRARQAAAPTRPIGPERLEVELFAHPAAGARRDVAGRHYEIHFSDPRRVPPERLHTLLRHPVQ